MMTYEANHMHKSPQQPFVAACPLPTTLAITIATAAPCLSLCLCLVVVGPPRLNELRSGFAVRFHRL